MSFEACSLSWKHTRASYFDEVGFVHLCKILHILGYRSQSIGKRCCNALAIHYLAFIEWGRSDMDIGNVKRHSREKQ